MRSLSGTFAPTSHVTFCARRVNAMLRDAYGICEHSLRKMVACSWPKTFSVRSLSSSPPNQTCEPLRNCANQSDFCTSAFVPGKHIDIIFGHVSYTMAVLRALNRNRIIAWREPEAFIA